jgi:hypothetical protein
VQQLIVPLEIGQLMTLNAAILGYHEVWAMVEKRELASVTRLS